MRTAVVILNWNTENFLRDFLPGLIHSVSRVDGAEVVVADNASTDGSMGVMQNMFPDIQVIRFEKNLGFTGGYNEAFRILSEEQQKQQQPQIQQKHLIHQKPLSAISTPNHTGKTSFTHETQTTNCESVAETTNCKSEAETVSPEYFLLINSDIEVRDGWLEPLIEWMDTHPECGACAPKLHSWHQKEMFEYAGAAGGYIDKYGYPFCRGRIMSDIEEDRGQYDTPAEVFWATGACLLVRSSVYAALGGLDNRFFAHMEEIDLCWRMKLEGYTVNIVPSSCVWHVGGGTLPSSSPMKLFLNYRNNLLMLSNNLAKTFAVEALNASALHESGAGTPVLAETPGKDRTNDKDKPNVRNRTPHKDILIEAAYQGIRKANKRILARMILDGMSAAVYIITFQWNSMMAVAKAHKQYRKMRRHTDAAMIAEYLGRVTTNKSQCPDSEKNNIKGKPHTIKPDITGIYPKWIILQSFIRKNKLPEIIRNWEMNI